MQFLIALIGLGVAIDYSLLVVVRWREERAHGREGDEAIVRAMETAGRAVVFSGTTVAIGLLALVALPLPFLRSVGYGGMLIPLISVPSRMTLLPVVLHSAGQRLDWPHRAHRRPGARAPGRAGRSGVVRHRWLAAVGALAPCSARSCVAATDLHPGLSNVDTIAQAGRREGRPRRAGAARASAPARCCRTRCSSRAATPERGRAAAARACDGIHGAVAPATPRGARAARAIVEAFPIPDGSSHGGARLVDDVRAAAHDAGAGRPRRRAARRRTTTSSTPSTATSR